MLVQQALCWLSLLPSPPGFLFDLSWVTVLPHTFNFLTSCGLHKIVREVAEQEHWQDPGGVPVANSHNTKVEDCLSKFLFIWIMSSVNIFEIRAPARLLSCSLTRSKFYVWEPVNATPNWVKVGLSLGTLVFMWIYLVQQHNEDVLEYKRGDGLE